MTAKPNNPNLRESRIAFDNDNHPYVIPADELTIFQHWLDAMEGRRHFPANFAPALLDSVESLRFMGWREVEDGK